MLKNIVIAIFVVLIIGVIFLASDIKDAYKVLPMKTEMDSTEPVPSFNQWQEFVAKSDKFKIKLPKSPQYVVSDIPIVGSDKKRLYEMYAAEKIDGGVFMINMITYPADFDTSDVQQLLHDAVQEMIQTKPGNKLESSKDTTFQGYKALDYSIVNNQFKAEGKAFLVGKTIYLLTYVHNLENFNEAEYHYFLNSFHLPEPLSKYTPAVKLTAEEYLAKFQSD